MNSSNQKELPAAFKVSAQDFGGWERDVDSLLSKGVSFLNYAPRHDPSSLSINALYFSIRELLSDEDSGVALLDLGRPLEGDTYLTAKAQMLVVILGNKFGRTVTKNYEDRSPFFPLYYRKEGNTRGYIGNGQSNNQPGVHTDGSAWREARVDLLGLLCVQSAAEGGTTIVVNALRVFEALPTAMKEFLRSRHFIRQDPFAPARPKPVRRTIYRDVTTGFYSGLGIRYDRSRIEGGHFIAGEPLSHRDLATLDEFDGVLKDTQFRHECFLESGQIMFINNNFICHDRTPFTDDEQKSRLLYRYWAGARIRAEPPPPSSMATPACRATE
jgi:alpha-ketoglutarate-dependent taurine dioxygenase